MNSDNGNLRLAAERDQFGVLITSDKNIRHQNRLSGMRIAVLERGPDHWPTLRRPTETVSVVLVDPRHGERRGVAFQRPPMVRGLPPGARGRANPSLLRSKRYDVPRTR